MFNHFMDDVDNFFDEAKEELLTIEKNYQKTIIYLWTASRYYSTSENRRLVLKTMKQTEMDELKGQIAVFSETFSDSVKGEWVDKAKAGIKEATKGFSELN